MIQKIEIERLFGRFNYSIAVKEQGITIITGPNGFGKSTILRIINALSLGNINYFFELDFSKLIILFDNDEKITIKKSPKTLNIDNLLMPNILDRSGQYQYGRRAPWIVRASNGDYVDRRTGETIPEEEMYYSTLFNTFNENYLDFQISKSTRDNLTKIKKKIDVIRSFCGEVRFISDQRLIKKQTTHRDDIQVLDVISELPKKLKNEIDKVAREYSQVSSGLDSSYPRRLFSTKEGLKDLDEYSLRLEEANQKFKKLNEYDLVEMSLLDDGYYTPELSTALKIYFDDFSVKYKVFEGLIAKLDLFTKIINGRLAFKKIRISREHGFEIVDINQNSKSLELSQLSSGEKQEIVLFYELIFETKSNLMLLIDEPEISLHITWQKKFLDDLMEVSKQNRVNVMVATHSPQIISNHLDFQVDLGELYGSELDKG